MDLVAKGDDFEKTAGKKLNGSGFFGSKYEDAADLFDKAASSFKLAKSCREGRVALLLWLVGRSFVGVDRLISVRSEAACCCFVVSICFLGWRLGEDIMLLFWLFLSWAVPAVDYANILQPSFVHSSLLIVSFCSQVCVGSFLLFV